MVNRVTLIQKLGRRIVNDDETYLANVKPHVYLSGPMENVSEKGGREWREEAKLLLTSHDLEAFDPYDFEQEATIPRLLVRTDFRCILASEGMLINASQNVVVWGSPMEVLWASMHKVINIAFVGDRTPSPWLSAHSKVVLTLNQAVECMAWEIRQL